MNSKTKDLQKRLEEIKRKRELIERQMQEEKKTIIGLLSDVMGSIIVENLELERKGHYFTKTLAKRKK